MMMSRTSLLALQILVAVVAIVLWHVLTTVPIGGVKLLPPFFFSTPLEVASRIVRWFAEGNAVTLSDEQPFAEYEAEMRKVPGLPEIAARFGRTREERALAGETVLEGLHQHLKLARNDLDSQVSYKEMVKFQLLKPRGGSGGSSSRRGGRDRGDIN